MEAIPWFECDDDELDPAQREFVQVLRSRAQCWPVQPIDTALPPPDRTPYGQLLAYLDIDDPERNRTVLTVGVHFDGAGVSGDKLHNQNFTLPSSPSTLALQVTGSPQGTAIRAAEWFEMILRRPLVRYEWLHAGQTYATRYVYADTGFGLSQSYVARLAPPGLTDCLIAGGFDRGGGWINTTGLGRPDRIAHVRGTDAPQ